jgi:hypothetical protein
MVGKVMDVTRQKRGKKPINGVAMTAAERKQRQRESFRENGGKTFAIDITGEKLKFVAAVSGDGKTEGEILRVILTGALDRWIEVNHKAVQLLALGASSEQVDKFLVDNRIQPVTDIADYFPATQ